MFPDYTISYDYASPGTILKQFGYRFIGFGRM